jgi:hypothetical protein
MTTRQLRKHAATDRVLHLCGLDSVVVTATGYGLDGLVWGSNPSKVRFPGPKVHPVSCTMGTGHLPEGSGMAAKASCIPPTCFQWWVANGFELHCRLHSCHAVTFTFTTVFGTYSDMNSRFSASAAYQQHCFPLSSFTISV